MKVKITGILGADGEWDFNPDEEPLTNGELHEIKKIAGVRAGEIEEAFSAGDNDLYVALAIIALARNGKQIPVRVLWDAPAGSSIDFIDDAVGVGEAASEPVPPDELAA